MKTFRHNYLKHKILHWGIVVLVFSFFNTGCDAITELIPLPKPVADFHFNEDSSYVAPCEIYFQNRSFYATSFEWDFNDGRIYSNSDKAYYFADAGIYPITLKATNADGVSETITKNIEILGSEEVPVKHAYDGKWIVDDPLSPSMNMKMKSEKQNRKSITTDGVDLAFNIRDDWGSTVLLRNSSFTDLENMNSSPIRVGERAIMAFSFINSGNATHNGLFNIAILVDGGFKYQWPINYPIDAGVSYFYYDIDLGNLALGNHTVKIILDPQNYTVEDNESNNIYETTFTISPKMPFESFEFSNNRYIIGLSNNEFKYGKLNYSEESIHMSTIGNCNVKSFSGNEMVIEIDGAEYKLLRETPTVPITNATMKLTNGYWKHTLAVDSINPNDEWMFTSSGTFVSLVAENPTFSTFTYENDSLIHIGSDNSQRLRINELSITRLRIKNALEQTYKLNTQIYK